MNANNVKQNNISYPKKKTILFLLLASLTALLVFEVGLSLYNYLPRPIDVTDLQINEHLDWRLDKSIVDRWFLEIEGFAFNKNNPPESPSFHVLLKNKATNEFLRLSTVYDFDPKVPELYGIDAAFDQSGFYAKTVMRFLNVVQNDYLIYILYHDHGQSFLIDTKETIPH